MIHSVLPNINRRNFLGRSLAALGGISVLNFGAGMVSGCGTKGNPLTSAAPAKVEQEGVSWQTVITSKDEPGEPLLVAGRIFGPDGKTPVAGLTLYVYHTDNRGLYSEEDGNGREPNPRLKGWMKTDAEGRYEFRTIKPTPYPGTTNRRHIHAKVYGAGRAEQWLDSFVFADDPLVPLYERALFASHGKFTPLMVSKRDGDGLIRCEHDIRLKAT
jgi:protocatechuate 3,4-dioxygenase, beta subunit